MTSTYHEALSIQEDADFAMALQLQADEEAGGSVNNNVEGNNPSSSFSSNRQSYEAADVRVPTITRDSGDEEGNAGTSPGWLQFFTGTSNPRKGQDQSATPERRGQGQGQGRERSYLEMDIENLNSSPEGLTLPTGGGVGDDQYLAWFLQRMEFEIPYETEEERAEREISGEFEGKEYRASKCKHQMRTISTCLVFVDVILFWVMCETEGMDDANPMIGPSSLAMVQWGAKDASLIVYRGQWWRLLSPIIMHAGVIHLLSNMLIQLRVGGYLNLVFGNLAFCMIYLLSGIFGNICSCLFIPDGVSVGASGALLGILSAWCVFIIFRWKKIPAQCHSQRNCQLTMVVVCIVITMAMSFASFVDWAAHMGGAVIGVLLGCIFLSKELDNENTRKMVRIGCTVATVVLFTVSIWYLAVKLRPPTTYLEFYDYVGVSTAPSA